LTEAALLIGSGALGFMIVTKKYFVIKALQREAYAALTAR
jgi:hypothetical protein